MNMNMNTSTSIGILILRLSIGLMMLLHGIAKLMHGIAPIEEMVIGAGMPAFFAYGVYIGEVIAPLLIILGIATRASSLVFVINCLVAIFMVHSTQLTRLTQQGGWAIELLGLYLFGALALVFMGGGKFAISKKHFLD